MSEGNHQGEEENKPKKNKTKKRRKVLDLGFSQSFHHTEPARVTHGRAKALLISLGCRVVAPFFFSPSENKKAPAIRNYSLNFVGWFSYVSL